MDFFAQKLLKWYKINKRDLPWRHVSDPYKVWLSEVILQQTQVVQGLNYYQKFVNQYITVKDLAMAPEDEVLRLWQGLGYYSRARNLHAAAKEIVKTHGGQFPKTYEEIRKLKGIGDYTAAAIASFSYNLPHAVVDGNVYRVLSRVFGVRQAIDSTQGKKYFKDLAQHLLPVKNASEYNQAIMEFGALYCRPVNPNCTDCIFNDSCLAYKNKEVSQLPVKLKKTKIKTRYFNYLVLSYKDTLYIHKRNEKDIWQGLYEFYLIESDKKMKEEQILSDKSFKQLIKNTNYKVKAISKEYKHILSHQHLYAKFYLIELKKPLPTTMLKKVKLQDLNRYAFPRLIEKHLKDIEILK